MIAVAIVIGIAAVYVLGRIDGKDKLKNEINDIFSRNRRNGRR